MTYEQVIIDLKKLIGLELHSIREGANVTIISIDEDSNTLVLLDCNGYKKRRPLNEMKKIWDALQEKPAIRVDEALHGSGSSRNQPETIMANLPYIEWARISNKKHIAYVGKNTHPFGTLKQMNPDQLESMSAANKTIADTANYQLIIVTDKVSECITKMQAISHGKITAVCQGYYAYETEEERVLFVTSSVISLNRGTYGVFQYRENPIDMPVISILDKKYYCLCDDSFKLLIPADDIQN